MPQETNLNVAPYFDDFDPQSNYYKVLFKPAYPIQARELNNLQSILQNQIEDMGTHFFKEGAKVIPGQLTYLPNFYAVQIESDFLGIPVSLYLDQLVGKKITGADSGVTAEVVTYITDQESNTGNFTLYVDYHDSSSTDNSTRSFFDNENLITTDNITFETTFIAAGEGLARTLTENANSVGSAFALGEGVYFLRGCFVDVQDQILILDQYTNKPSYRIGLVITENLISSDIDPSLNDNAKNFTNYTAPGADRLEIKAVLGKKDRFDYNDQNFVQLAEVNNGILREINTSTDYNMLGEELAKRTFDESGHYYVKQFVTTVKESLNNGIGNRGIYNPNQTTSSGQKPSEDLMVYKISPGKAYVKGHPIDIVGPTFLDVPKARTTKNLKNQSVNFGFGPSFSVNNVTGSPFIGFNNTNFLSLRSNRVGSATTDSAGKEIGVARVYDFALESGSYEISQKSLNQWDLSLFDIQTYNDFEVNENVTLTIPCFIEGESSGATGYLRYPVSVGTGFTAYNINGNFSLGERLKFNGEDFGQRTVIDSKKFETSDVQSVYGIVGSAGTFTADLIPQTAGVIGIASISTGHYDGSPLGIATISGPGGPFPGIVTTGNLIKYSNSGLNVQSFGRVTNVSTNSFEIVGVQTVTGFVDGRLPSEDLSVTDLEVIESRTQLHSKSSGNIADNNSLFSALPKKFISNVDLTDSTLTIRRQFDVTIADNSTGAVNSDPGEVFLPYDEERYSLISDAGQIQILSSDRFTFAAGSNQITINGLDNDGPAKLICTLRKTNATPKVKIKKISSSVVIDKSSNSGSGIGATTLDDGLTYGSFPYGTRVQDRNICLNVPDVIIVYGIFQGEGSNNPVAPSMVLGSMDGPTNTTNDLIVGEEVIGSISGARALYVVRLTDTNIEFIFENQTPFEPGEVINFQNSGISAVATKVSMGSKNITSSFDSKSGQRKTIYDFSRIQRREGASIPTNKIKVYFMSAEYDSADTGDITICNSYNGFNYSTDIATFAGFRLTDLIDARPRVSPYTPTSSSRSPFEFFGRSFNGGQHSSRNILASDESTTIGFDYYLGRIDRVYLDKDGIFQVKQGSPSDNPVLPMGITGSMNISNLYIPAYTHSVQNVETAFIQHKRYQMTDISKLEQRIKNLEYYTSLNQLESTTMNQFIPDANGLNRFRSGIFVDNFRDIRNQDLTIGAKNSIDRSEGILRPSHYTTNKTLMVGNDTMSGIGTGTNSNEDSKFANILGENTKRTGQIITLDYSEESWLKQPFATRSESVTPFLVQFWNGTISFEPSVDVWIEVNELDVKDVLQEGSFRGVAEAMRAEVTTNSDGKRSGISPVIWKAWETTGVNVSVDLSQKASKSKPYTSERQGTRHEFGTVFGVGTRETHPDVPSTFKVTEEHVDTNVTTDLTVGVQLNQQRRGTQTSVTEQIDTESLGDRIVNREVIHFMRARNIQFTSKSLKPFTQMYSFFDNVDVNKYVMPKLVEVTMTSGTFVVGEAIGGLMPSSLSEQSVDSTNTDFEGESPTASIAAIVARVADPTHKYGPYNRPSTKYDRNPYDRENRLPTSYTESTTILNIDISSLADETNPEYQGYIAKGMVLLGVNSGAKATVTDVRLVSDRLGTLIGSFRVPGNEDSTSPRFETGNNRFRITSSSTNSKVEGLVSTSAEDNFYSQGDIDDTQEVTLSLRNARVEHNDNFVETRNTVQGSGSDTSTVTTGTSSRLTGEYKDPLAQSFIVDDETGIFVTSLDLYFQEKPTEFSEPVTVQIREVELGTPSQKIIPFSEVQKTPDEIEVSNDCSIVTKFTFESPVYLNGQREYAIIILSNSTEYRVWISRLGEVDVQTLGSETDQILVTTQRLLGSLFKSQNASTWTPSQYEDLTFELHRAEFQPNGNIQLFNPSLDDNDRIIPHNGVVSSSRTIKVGFGTTTTESDLKPGNLVTQRITGATGRFVGYGGSASQMNLSIVNAGIGYTPSSGTLKYTGVAMTSLSGDGINATADLTITNGVAVGASINSGGFGYQVGDILAPLTIGTGLGDGIKVSISTIHGNNELTLNNVQGEFGTTVGQILDYTNSAGVTTIFNYDANASGMVPEAPIRVVTNGDHLRIDQRNHGMYSNTNVVSLKDISSSISHTTLTTEYKSDSTTSIAIANTSNFGIFEHLGIGITNPGYILMNDEIIKYTGMSGNELTGITRGIDDTNIIDHGVDEIVQKYEFHGVSLRRINKDHLMNAVTEPNAFDTDFYKVKIDMSQNGLDRTGSIYPKLYFDTSDSGGGNKAMGSYNIPFSQAIPKIETITPTGTSIDPSMRTISATSISGNEGPFVDQGFEKIALGQVNYFDTQRMMASPTNENLFLDDLPGNKSMSISLDMSSSDSRISPAVDVDQMSVVLISNRVNEPVSDYANDPRVDSVLTDPNKFMYVTKPVILANPGTSIQVYLDAFLTKDSDIRVFFAIDQEGPAKDVIFTPFPGSNNFASNGSVINFNSSNGAPDQPITKSDSLNQDPSISMYREYKFSIDNLPAFGSFRIKLIGTSTNQASPPMIRNFRTLGLA